MMDDNNRRLQQLAPELRDIILEHRPSTRGTLHLVLTLAGKAKPEKRAAIWSKFEANRQIGDSVRRLHEAFDIVSERVARKDAAFEQWQREIQRRSDQNC